MFVGLFFPQLFYDGIKLLTSGFFWGSYENNIQVTSLSFPEYFVSNKQINTALSWHLKLYCLFFSFFIMNVRCKFSIAVCRSRDFMEDVLYSHKGAVFASNL